MDVKPFLESGKIEEYCLGLLSTSQNDEVLLLAEKYPEIKAEVGRVEAALKKYAAVPVKSSMKQAFLDTLTRLNEVQAIDLNNPPRINRHSNYKLWNESLSGLQPDYAFGTTKTNLFFKDGQVQLCIAWMADQLMEEGHDDDNYHESFLILEGSCVCNLGGRFIHLDAGDFLDIPAATQHTIINTSKELGYVKAVIQRVKKMV